MAKDNQIISTFFDTYGFYHARSLLGRIIKAAASQKVYKGNCPANVLHYMQKLQQLIEAAFTIIKQNDVRQGVRIKIIDTNKLWSLTNYETYCGYHIHSTPWHFFPRHLSQKEFLDPCMVLQKFTNKRPLKQWKQILKQITEQALSPQAINEMNETINILSIWLHLHKLIEAAHLIHVRTHDKQNPPHFKPQKSKN